jgi:hypothetical protein
MSGYAKARSEEENDDVQIEEGGNVVQNVESQVHDASSIINPDFAKLDEKQQIAKIQSFHWWAMVVFLGATIAYWTIFGTKKDTLGINRTVPIFINIISPPVNGTGNGYLDAFQVQWTFVSNAPIIALLATSATVMFIYFALHALIYKNWVINYIACESNPCRWLFIAASKTLYFIPLFIFNGDREITSLLYIAGLVTGICFLGHALEEATKRSCKDGKRGYKHVEHYQYGVYLLATLLVTAFIIRLAYNKQATPQWVMVLSIIFVIYEYVMVVYFAHSAGQACKRCTASGYRVHFLTGDYRITFFHIVGFLAASATIIGEQDAM